MIVIVPYIYLFLCHKPIRDKPQGRRVIFYSLITHFLCFKVIRDIVQLPWVYFKGLDTQFLCLKRSVTRKNTAGLLRTAWLHISYVLRWSRIYLRVYENWATVSLHISCVLKCSGISLIQRGILSLDRFIHILRVRQGSNFMDRTQIVFSIIDITLVLFECVLNCPKPTMAPKSTFFNDVFIAYPCMRRPSRTAINDKL